MQNFLNSHKNLAACILLTALCAGSVSPAQAEDVAKGVLIVRGGAANTNANYDKEDQDSNGRLRQVSALCASSGSQTAAALVNGEMDAEAVLAAIDGVVECAVIGVADQLKGELPLGLVVLKAGVDRDPETIRQDRRLATERTDQVAVCCHAGLLSVAEAQGACLLVDWITSFVSHVLARAVKSARHGPLMRRQIWN